MSGLKDAVENHPIGVWILSLGAIISLIINALVLRDALLPHQYYGAQEFANEYIAVLAEFDLYDDALSKFNDVYALSVEFPEHDENCQCNLNIRPDEIELARSVKHKGKWIIGLDRKSGQSDFKKVRDNIIEINDRLKKISNNASCSNELTSLAKKGLEYLQERYSKDLVKAEYYSVTRYASMYGANLVNYRKNGL